MFLLSEIGYYRIVSLLSDVFTRNFPETFRSPNWQSLFTQSYSNRSIERMWQTKSHHQLAEWCVRKFLMDCAISVSDCRKEKALEKKSMTRNEKSVDYLLLIMCHNPCVPSFLIYQLTMSLYVETSWRPYRLFHRTFTRSISKPHLLCRVNRVLCIPRLSEIVSCRLPPLNWIIHNPCACQLNDVAKLDPYFAICEMNKLLEQMFALAKRSR